MFKLIWLVVALLPRGPLPMTIDDSTSFKNKAECVAFAEERTERFKDWVRGGLNAPWELSVSVSHVCEPVGDPA